MHETTVVGWDGSETAETALAWAIGRAERQPEGARSLELLRAVDPNSIAGDDRETAELVRVAETEAAAAVARVRSEHPSLDVAFEVLRDEPGDALCDRTGDDRLVVVGAENGRTDEFWHSSRLGVRLCGMAGGPVAVIPTGDVRPRSGVLVAVDHGPAARDLCRFAAAYAVSVSEALHAMHVGSRSHTVGDDVEELEEALAPARHEHPDLEIVTHVESGPVAAMLLRRAQDHDAVIVGSRRLGPVRRLFLGSVSHAVVTNARCPTIVVPPTHGSRSPAG
ncbi:universal stress protein [Agromyces binzhouensis]|uniref:universal stress protein n=1 Tax=Agromyces binzhouensis TaxID=1817495 RepID=UPI0036453D5B